MDKAKLIERLRIDSRRRHLYIGSFLFLVIFLFMFFSQNGLYTRIKLENEISELENNIQSKKENILDLQREKKLLKKDTLAIEKVAREKYGYVKEGEKTYIITD